MAANGKRLSADMRLFHAPSWREMSWAERFAFIGAVILGLGDDFLSVVAASTITPRKIKWLWPNRIPLGNSACLWATQITGLVR